MRATPLPRTTDVRVSNAAVSQPPASRDPILEATPIGVCELHLCNQPCLLCQVLDADDQFDLESASTEGFMFTP